MSERLTDLLAIRRALYIAIDHEESLIDAWTPDDWVSDEIKRAIAESDEPQIAIHRKNIAAFRRVLDRYFGGQKPDPLADVKPVPISQLLRDSPFKGG